MSRALLQTRHSRQRPDCLAGHVGLELRNVDANYPLEKSRRFAGIQPNSGHGDHSRLSCGAGDTQLGPGQLVYVHAAKVFRAALFRRVLLRSLAASCPIPYCLKN
jgi:hypothetical protein